MNWKTLIVIAAAALATACNAMPSSSSSADSAEKVLSRLKSFGLELKSDNFNSPRADEPWHIFLTDGVEAVRHVSPLGAEDYCWVQKNKNEPKSCSVKGGWSVAWGRDTSAGVIAKLEQFGQ